MRLPHEQVGGAGQDVWSQAAASADFRLLRTRLLWFVVPATVGFMGPFFVYVALHAWAPGALGLKVVGELTLTLVLGIGQFVNMFAITIAYARYAHRRLDPLADRIRGRLERGQA